jgi:predicted nucleotidyltransferase
MSRFSRSAAETIPAAASKKKFLRVCTPLEYDLQRKLNLPLRSVSLGYHIGCNSDYAIMKVESMSQTLEIGNTRIDSTSLAEVCRRYGVKELAVFGSALRGEIGPESDIDLMVEFEPAERVGLIRFESLIVELEALAGRRVDLVTKRGLKPWVRPEVLKVARVIYAA